MNTVITNVQIFDGTSSSLYPGEVELQGNRILHVAPGREQLSVEGKRTLDGAGATLMPGLVNTHAHLTYPAVVTLAEVGQMPVEENMMEASYNARTALDFGFTAVVSGAAAKPRLDIVLRNEINALKNDPRALEALGRKEFGFARPGEVIYQFN